MAKYLIDGSTLTEIADAIRNNSPTSWAGQNITPEMMPAAIEDCYYDGYDEGYSGGIRTLRGSFTLKEYIERFGMYGTYPCPRGIYTDFAYNDDDGEVEWAYEEIDRIEISEDYVDFFSVSGRNKYNDYGGWYGEDDAMEGHVRHEYIEILEPVQVSQGLYEVLNNLISFDNFTPFYLGYDAGWEDGYAEASKPNLTNVTYDIPLGWIATAGYGAFNVNGTITCAQLGSGSNSFDYINIGKHPAYPAEGYIEIKKGDTKYYVQNTYAFTITFTGGADVTNTSLINWLDANGRSSNSLDLEALGTLCDWQITTDSNSWPVITIVNYHPSYYLHCAIYDEAGSSMYDPDTDIYFDGVSVVVPPNSSRSVAFDYSFSYIKPLYIDNVRWKASAT